MFAVVRPCLVLLGLMTILTGVAYPFIVTGLAQALFPHQANGSLIVHNGKVVGSQLIGQSFEDARYFWGRPSATSPVPYNAGASAGSNLGPTNPTLLELVQARVTKVRQMHPGQSGPIPADLVTASASGLDPHITPAAAYFQTKRVAQARSLDAGRVRTLVSAHVEEAFLKTWGERRVNVLRLNLALDALQ
jgi:K+-transporting ATPase ATPase C chain